MMMLYGEAGRAGGPRGRRGVGVNLQAQGWGQVGWRVLGGGAGGFILQLTLFDSFQRSDQARSDQV